MTEAKQLVSLCTENHLTISSCESLTAGLFTSTIASIPGASAILKGGLVTYFTPMKSVLAHVDVNLIQNYGVISCLLYTSPSPRDYAASRMPSSA